jgi:hypothetical protein
VFTGTSRGHATFSAGRDLARRNAVTDVKPTTTDAGALVESDEHSLTVGPDGPVLLQDHYHPPGAAGAAFRADRDRETATPARQSAPPAMVSHRGTCPRMSHDMRTTRPGTA